MPGPGNKSAPPCEEGRRASSSTGSSYAEGPGIQGRSDAYFASAIRAAFRKWNSSGDPSDVLGLAANCDTMPKCYQDLLKRNTTYLHDDPGASPREVAGRMRKAALSDTREMGEEILDMLPPLPEQVPEALPYPTSVLPRSVARLVREGAAALGIGEGGIGALAIAAAGGAIGCSRLVALKRGHQEPATIWCVLVMPSGARKSPALDTVLAPLRAKEGEWYGDWKNDTARAAQASTGTKKKDVAPIPLKRLTVSDITFEALVSALGDNRDGLLMARDEASAFLLDMGKYSGTAQGEAAAYAELSRYGHVSVTRKTGPTPHIAVRSTVGIVGTTQPGTLRSIADDGLVALGFVARFLFVSPEVTSYGWSDAEVSDLAASGWTRTLKRLVSLRLGADPIPIPLSNAAKETLRSYVNEVGEQIRALPEDSPMRPALSKLQGYSGRIAMILAYLSWAEDPTAPEPTEISEAAATGAVALARWHARELERVYFGLMARDPRAAERAALLKWVIARGGATARDVAHGPRRYRGQTEQAEIALESLAKEGALLRVIEPPGRSRGRAVTRYLPPEDGGPSGPGLDSPVFPEDSVDAEPGPVEPVSDSAPPEEPEEEDGGPPPSDLWTHDPGDPGDGGQAWET